MKEFNSQIAALEARIAEKENEIQLLKDDVEALRTAIESALDEQEINSGNSESVKEDTDLNLKSRAEEEELNEAASEGLEPSSGSDNHEANEQDQEAIMRTIESFASKKKASGLDYNGPINDRTSLGEHVANVKLNDIKKAMGINERFLYANELFHGDMSAFSKAIEELNHLESFEDASRLLEEELSIKFQWDEENETVTAFKSLISRRFA
ncbi:MAG: hypothetical protein WEC59_10275 [Salibacteraceae bacterium]